MGKVAPEPLVSQRTHSGKSYWVRNILAVARDNADAVDRAPVARGAPKAPATKKRFVEPYRLTDEQRAAMLAPLAERGIGDPESRELFAAALAYDLATCYEQTVVNAQPAAERAAAQAAEPALEEAAERPRQVAAKGARKAAQKAAADPQLAELAEAARVLAAQLGALGSETRARLLQGLGEADLFRRGYDEAYLSALQGELLRLAQGGVAPDKAEAASPTQVAPPPERRAAPKPSPAARQFIARAAGAFEQCFDQAPTAQAGGPFAAMLKALVSITGVRIPTDARNLAELLKRT